MNTKENSSVLEALKEIFSFQLELNTFERPLSKEAAAEYIEALPPGETLEERIRKLPKA